MYRICAAESLYFILSVNFKYFLCKSDEGAMHTSITLHEWSALGMDRISGLCIAGTSRIDSWPYI